MNTPQNNDFAQKLKEYDDAFDFYMDYGKLPENMSKGDLLGGFIGQTIQDNPQLESQDPLWTELLKEELMKFIEAMLQLFQPIEEYHRKEQAFIAVFVGGGLMQKRIMWGQTTKIIEQNYKPGELNLEGYKDQLNECSSEQQKEIILNALGHEWKKASDDKVEERKQNVLSTNQKRWEQHLKEYGLSDYKERQKVERFFYSYPELRELIRMIGREQPQREDEMDDTIRRYLPILPSSPKPAAEAEEIANGNDLQHLLPSETAILSERQTENQFFYKFATQRFKRLPPKITQPRSPISKIFIVAVKNFFYFGGKGGRSAFVGVYEENPIELCLLNRKSLLTAPIAVKPALNNTRSEFFRNLRGRVGAEVVDNNYFARKILYALNARADKFFFILSQNQHGYLSHSVPPK